ncbi:MAG: hypothetical protein FWF50_07100 [Defluviitaleaceae bacterium]|nr:hypothetical protein [Defluviitaleaceae bacterium]
MKIKKSNNSGLSLLELTVSLLLFGIVIFSAVNITSFVLNRTMQVQINNEQIFNANLAMNSIVIHIYESESFSLETWANGTLQRINFYPHNNTIDFRVNDNTLRFGNQILSRYIEDVIININGTLMHIFVITEAITLTRTIDIRYNLYQG